MRLTKRIHFRKAILLLACVLMFLQPAVMAIAAEDVNSGGQQLDQISNYHNYMLVIDMSGSLVDSRGIKGTDDAGLRYEAIDTMFRVFQNNGHEIGAIVFNSEPRIVAPIAPITSASDKEKILSKIKAAGVHGYTDIGAALELAVNELESKQKQQEQQGNGHLKSHLILLTDGVTQVNDSKNPNDPGNLVSYEKRNDAIERAKGLGITVSGFFLNTDTDGDGVGDSLSLDGKENHEVFNIVRASRDIASDPTTPRNADGDINSLDGQYFEIVNPDSLNGIADPFVVQAKKTNNLDPSDPPVQTVPCLKAVDIPSVGVSELNVVVRYDAEFRDKIAVNLLMPDGKTIIREDDPRVSKGSISYTVKISEPPGGLWFIRVEKIGEGTSAEVMIDPIGSTDVYAVLQKPTQTLRFNEAHTWISHLTQKNERVVGETKYKGYSCTLEAGEEEFGMTMLHSYDGFAIPDVRLSMFSIKASAIYEGGQIYEYELDEEGQETGKRTNLGYAVRFKSPQIEVQTEVDPVERAVSYNIFADGKCTINLKDLFKGIDSEAIPSFDPDSISNKNMPLENLRLTTDGKLSAVNVFADDKEPKVITVMVTDSLGAEAPIMVTLIPKNGGPLFYGVIGGILILLLLVGLFVFSYLKNIRLSRNMKIMVSGVGFPVAGKLAPSNFKGKFTLFDACKTYIDRSVASDQKDALYQLIKINRSELSKRAFIVTGREKFREKSNRSDRAVYGNEQAFSSGPIYLQNGATLTIMISKQSNT